MTENLAGTFLEIARQRAAKPIVRIKMFCTACFEDCEFNLFRETKLDEHYRCMNCGAIKIVRVR